MYLPTFTIKKIDPELNARFITNYLSKEKGMSKGELTAVIQAVKGMENQQLLRTPVVRNGKLATVGYQPDVWKGWS